MMIVTKKILDFFPLWSILAFHLLLVRLEVFCSFPLHTLTQNSVQGRRGRGVHVHTCTVEARRHLLELVSIIEE